MKSGILLPVRTTHLVSHESCRQCKRWMPAATQDAIMRVIRPILCKASRRRSLGACKCPEEQPTTLHASFTSPERALTVASDRKRPNRCNSGCLGSQDLAGWQAGPPGPAPRRGSEGEWGGFFAADNSGTLSSAMSRSRSMDRSACHPRSRLHKRSPLLSMGKVESPKVTAQGMRM